MAVLYVKIDRKARTAVFWGPGTFDAKELIKELGMARWNGANKEWQVSNFALADGDLRARFGEDLSIEEGAANGGNAKSTPESKPAAKPSAKKKAPKKVSVDTTSGLPASLSVSEFFSEVRGLLRQSFPEVLYVHGVLSSVKEVRGGRLYMDLVDPDRPDDQVSCVVWQGADSVLKPLNDAGFIVETDLQVMFKVQVDLNPRRGALSLTVVGVVPEYTLGKLAALREKTNERLKKEGLFEKNQELTLPFLPRRLGILTSAGGTVINDFRASLDEAEFGFELLWMNVSVQGAEAKKSLIQAITAFGERSDVDAILLFRGGGSAAELAVFSEYEIAKAVCLCPLPIVSAIGHQEDQSSVQDVSCVALGVPKDVGRYFADIVIQRRASVDEFIRVVHDGAARLFELLQQRVNDLSRGLLGSVRLSLRGAVEGVAKVQTSLPVQASVLITHALERLSSRAAPTAALASRSCSAQVARLATLSGRIANRSERAVEREESRLRVSDEILRSANWNREQREQSLAALSRIIKDAGPETQLQRGFSMVKVAGTEIYITSAAALSSGDDVELQFHDAGKTAKIT